MSVICETVGCEARAFGRFCPICRTRKTLEGCQELKADVCLPDGLVEDLGSPIGDFSSASVLVPVALISVVVGVAVSLLVYWA